MPAVAVTKYHADINLMTATPLGATENARHENAARGKMQGWKMVHKNAGRENAGLGNTAQEIPGWKMREKLVWKANRRFI